MALWLARSGKHGEHEHKFLQDDRVYVCWSDLSHDLSKHTSASDLFSVLKEAYPGSGVNKLKNHARQISVVVCRMMPGDWVVMPSKLSSTIHFGEVKGPYEFHAEGPDPYWHSRKVHWFASDIPRIRFAQDLLYSFGAFLTFCQIKKNDAEQRVHAMAENDWSEQDKPPTDLPPDDESAVAHALRRSGLLHTAR